MDLTNPLPSEFTRLLAQEKDVSLFLDAKEKNETSHLKIVLRTLALAGPMTASYTFSFSLVAIAVMMGRIGSQEDLDEYLAATPLITTGMQSFAFLMASSVLGTSLEAGKRFGELQRLETDEPDNNHDISEQLRSIREVFRASMGLSTLITPLGMLGMYHTEELLNLIHINPEVTALVGQFLRIYSFALPGFMLRISSEQMLFAYGKTVPAMVIGLISFAVNTALAAWLAFGSPQLGIPGIALGYLAEAYLTAFGFSAYIAFQKKFRPLELFKLSHLSTSIFKTLKTLLGLGLPITLQFAAEIAIDQLSLMFAGWLGTTALAAQAFTTQLKFITIIPIITFGQSVSQEVSRAVGEEHFKYATRFSRMGLITSFGMIAPLVIPFVIKPEWLSALMTHHDVNPQVMTLVNKIIPFTALGIFADTARFGMIETLRPANQTVMPTLVSIIIMGLGLLASYLLGVVFDAGLLGIELGSMTGLILAAAVIIPIWLYSTQSKHFKEVKTASSHQPLISTWNSDKSSSSFFSQRNSNIEDMSSQKEQVVQEGQGDEEINATSNNSLASVQNNQPFFSV